MPDSTCPKCTLGPPDNSKHAPISCGPSIRIPYAVVVLGSHLCVGCGKELCRVAAPPDPVYGLPICTCPNCGTSCVRRFHRLRTHPIAFRRLDRAFNRIAIATAVIVLVAGSALMISVIGAYQAEMQSAAPWPALLHSIRSASVSDIVSISFVIGIVSMIQLMSGMVLGGLLWHWKTGHLGIAWFVVLLAVSLLPLVPLVVQWEPKLVSADLAVTWPARLQVLALCWLATAVGLAVGAATGRDTQRKANRRFRRSLRWARKHMKKRRNG